MELINFSANSINYIKALIQPAGREVGQIIFWKFATL